MKKFIEFIKTAFDILLFCLGCKGSDTARYGVDLDILDFSGQGRNRYGM